ncbi:MAG: BON domain-containing protein, partial [Ramlibacter sp.]
TTKEKPRKKAALSGGMQRIMGINNETLNIDTVAAFAAGALALFCLESLVMRRRRARIGEKIGSASRRAVRAGEHVARHIADQVKGVVATGSLDRVSSREPENDAQLRERVMARLGHLVSHPGAIDISVREGIVRVSGQVLAQELDGLLTQLTHMPGVHKVHNALGVLQDPSGFGEAQPTRTPA